MSGDLSLKIQKNNALLGARLRQFSSGLPLFSLDFNLLSDGILPLLRLSARGVGIMQLRGNTAARETDAEHRTQRKLGERPIPLRNNNSPIWMSTDAFAGFRCTRSVVFFHPPPREFSFSSSKFKSAAWCGIEW
jgi:hypothetical protein